MNVTKITIGRLYNLGSYEHVRYELTCEIPTGESPATAIIGMENIIDALNPKEPEGVLSVSDLKRMADMIAAIKELSDEDFAIRHGNRISRTENVADAEKKLARRVQIRGQWEARAAKARKLLEDLGGAANWRDAKLEWDLSNEDNIF